jgi:hypothetical protein
MASMIGEEVTSFSHGHFNAFPIVRDPSSPTGGAFDHAGGEYGPTLRMPQLYDGIHSTFPGSVVQLNHPRGTGGGVLTLLKVDTATLKSHGTPSDYYMAPDPTASGEDTKLFGDGFDCIETANGPTPNFSVLNDWMTFLSRGTVRTATGVSDTHNAVATSGGYARTYAKVDADTPADFDPKRFAAALRAHEAFATNGPYLKFSARKLSGGDAQGIGSTLSIAKGGEDVELTVDVTGLEWMAIDRVEIYSYAPGRDAADGQSNSSWPDSRIFDRHLIASPTIEAVPGPLSLRRVHQVEKFIVHPTADTWFVAMARGVNGRTMWPLNEDPPIAYTNPILIDADGSGAYDDFPLKEGTAKHKARARARGVPTFEQAEAAIRHFIQHKHE